MGMAVLKARFHDLKYQRGIINYHIPILNFNLELGFSNNSSH